MSGNSGNEKRTIWTWAFNPFHYIAGGKALAIGLVIMLLAGWLAWLAECRFDGLLDFHLAQNPPWWIVPLDALVNWVPFSLLLYLGGLWLSRSRVRLVDVVGTQAFARFPYFLLGLAVQLPGWRRVVEQMLQAAQTPGAGIKPAPVDVVSFIILTITILAGIGWMVTLMWRAFAVSCNVRGGKAIAYFIGAIIVGETASKLLLWLARTL